MECAPVPSAFMTVTCRSLMPRLVRSRRKTIFRPSGDQAVPQSSPPAQGAGSDAAQPVSWWAPVPLALIVQIPPLPGYPIVKTILEPSGLQSGTWS